jgi:hypothetical protein
MEFQRHGSDFVFLYASPRLWSFSSSDQTRVYESGASGVPFRFRSVDGIGHKRMELEDNP